MEHPVSRALGAWRGVTFTAAQIDFVQSADDLLIVGMLEKDVARGDGGGADALDDALHGTLSRLRAGGIFTGGFGETLMLTRPPAPLRAGALMLMGMGASRLAQPSAMGNLTAIAMRAALGIGAESVGCLLGWSERDLADGEIEPRAIAMMQGALGAIDAQGGGREVAVMHWTFDIRNSGSARTAAALAATLAAWY